MEEIKWQPASELYTERQIPSNSAVYHPADNSALSEFMMFPLVSNSSSINYSFLPLNPSLFVSFISKVRMKNTCVLVFDSARRLMQFLTASVSHQSDLI